MRDEEQGIRNDVSGVKCNVKFQTLEVRRWHVKSDRRGKSGVTDLTPEVEIVDGR